MLREKMGQLRDLQDKVNEICVQCDEPEYETDEPLEAKETEDKAAACQPTTSKPTTKHRLPALSCRQHKRVYCHSVSRYLH